MIEQLKNVPPQLRDVRHPVDNAVCTDALFKFAELHPNEPVELDLLAFETLFMVRVRGFTTRLTHDEMASIFAINDNYDHEPVSNVYIDSIVGGSGSGGGFWLVCELTKVDYSSRRPAAPRVIEERNGKSRSRYTLYSENARYGDDDSDAGAGSYARRSHSGGSHSGNHAVRDRSRSPPRRERSRSPVKGGFMSVVSSLIGGSSKQETRSDRRTRR